MSFNKISIGALNTMYTDLLFLDKSTREIIYGSVVSYSTTLNVSLKEIQSTGTHCYVPTQGTFRTVRNGYACETKKDNLSDYAHGIFYAKDKVEYLENGSENIQIYIYSNTIEELKDKLFAKVSKHSSVPVLKEWKDYLHERLTASSKLREMYKLSNIQSTDTCHRAIFNKNDIKEIVTAGLRLGYININGNNSPSQILSNIHGLNDYLSCFGETLAEKIQTSFKPKFMPGEDEYDKYTNFADDFIFHEADIELFEAQKTIVQATVNNLNVNDVTYIIAEMGSGSYVI